jgi:hypothetical protein
MPSYASRLTPDEIADLVGVSRLAEGAMTLARLAVVAGARRLRPRRAARRAQVTADRLRARPTSRRTGSLTRAPTPASATACCGRSTPATTGTSSSSGVLPNQTFGAWQVTPLVVDGVDVPHAASQRRAAVTRRRARVLAIPLHRFARIARVLRRPTTAGWPCRFDALHGHARRPSSWRSTPPGGPIWERRGWRPYAGLLDHDGAAGREGQDSRRRRRRRVRHRASSQAVRVRLRQGAVALLHGAGPGERGARDVERRRVEDRAAARCG